MSDIYIDKNDFDFNINQDLSKHCLLLVGNICNIENYDVYYNFLNSLKNKFKKIFIIKGSYDDSQEIDVNIKNIIFKNLIKDFKNIILLNNEYYVLDNILIFGSTLYTEQLNEIEYKKSCFFLHNALSVSKRFNYKSIILTSYPPSYIYCKDITIDNNDSKLYNNLDYYFDESYFDYWIFGSTKYNIEICLKNTFLLSNQFINNKENFSYLKCIEIKNKNNKPNYIF